MRYRQFGTTGEFVSEIGFGGAAISGEGAGYGFGHIEERESIRLLHFVQEKGINLFDTAPIYGFRESEKRMGKAFRGRRDDVFLVSKCGITWHENKRVNLDNGATTTRRMLEQSLRDLQTDYIDLYMVHWPDSRVDIRETMQVLSDARRAGKIRFIGLCNSNPSEYQLAKQVGHVDVFQTEMNVFKTSSFEKIRPIIHRDGQGHMTWGTLEKGILTGSVTRDRKFDDVDCRGSAPWWKEMDLEGRFRVMDELQPILDGQGLSGLTMALAFNLSYPENSTVLCGGRNEDQWNGILRQHACKDRVGQGLLLKARQAVAHHLS